MMSTQAVTVNLEEQGDWSCQNHVTLLTTTFAMRRARTTQSKKVLLDTKILICIFQQIYKKISKREPRSNEEDEQ